MATMSRVGNYVPLAILPPAISGCHTRLGGLSACQAGFEERDFVTHSYHTPLICFEHGSRKPLAKINQYLDSVVFSACNAGTIHFEVQGNIESSEVNLKDGKLGLERAESIAGLLVECGIKPGDTLTKDRGSFAYLVPTGPDTPEYQIAGSL